MLLIYSSYINTRLSYIVATLLGESVSITTDKDVFKQHHGERINYSDESITENECRIQPFGLLNETGIDEQQISCRWWKDKKIFFETHGDIPFDIFSASFYLITRYEEYLPYAPDEYGRYEHTNSLAYKEGFLDSPLVNQWVAELGNLLTEKFPSFQLRVTNFRLIPTYDIDIAYSYLYHPLYRNVFGFYRDLLLGKFEAVSERAGVYSGSKKDPFDVYDWLDELHKKYQLEPIYFFLMAEKRKGKDKNIAPGAKAMHNLIKRHHGKYAVGIHPSLQTKNDTEIIKKELGFLLKAGAGKVTRSRQHYIRIRFPDTYRSLVDAGITDEYSMGYSDSNGFRASYALPFSWYDLSSETHTSLVIHPFCFMDATASFQQRVSAGQAWEELTEYYEKVRSVGGELITIYHNHFLTEQDEWIEWRNRYALFLANHFNNQMASASI